MLELLLVAHGGAHNDTIVTVERKMQGDLFVNASPYASKNAEG
jgi:hypothetical protein